jgi:hypothetical protein
MRLPRIEDLPEEGHCHLADFRPSYLGVRCLDGDGYVFLVALRFVGGCPRRAGLPSRLNGGARETFVR